MHANINENIKARRWWSFVTGIHGSPVDSPAKGLGPVLLTFFATRRKNFSQWHRSFQRKLRSHWLKFLRHVAITLVIQGPATQKKVPCHDVTIHTNSSNMTPTTKKRIRLRKRHTTGALDLWNWLIGWLKSPGQVKGVLMDSCSSFTDFLSHSLGSLHLTVSS